MTTVPVLEWTADGVRFLDQTRLPDAEEYCVAADESALADAIRRLAIRGAPLIGIAASYGVALAAFAQLRHDPSLVVPRIQRALDLLAGTRPTAVNLFWALQRQREIARLGAELSPGALAEALLAEAQRIHRDDEEMCERISEHGCSLLPPECVVLTHCNAGALATGGRGTALGIISLAYERGTLRHVFIDETRPLLQGARLTSWELQRQHIPVTLLHDSAAAHVMRTRQVHAVIVGADRIAANGDTANKIGTYHLAIAASYHRIPFYVAAPASTIDHSVSSGEMIPIEERSSDEVTSFGGRRTAPPAVSAIAPAFDVTPASLITAIVTDRGIIRPPFEPALRTYGTSPEAR